MAPQPTPAHEAPNSGKFEEGGPCWERKEEGGPGCERRPLKLVGGGAASSGMGAPHLISAFAAQTGNNSVVLNKVLYRPGKPGRVDSAGKRKRFWCRLHRRLMSCSNCSRDVQPWKKFSSSRVGRLLRIFISHRMFFLFQSMFFLFQSMFFLFHQRI